VEKSNLMEDFMNKAVQLIGLLSVAMLSSAQATTLHITSDATRTVTYEITDNVFKQGGFGCNFGLDGRMLANPKSSFASNREFTLDFAKAEITLTPTTLTLALQDHISPFFPENTLCAIDTSFVSLLANATARRDNLHVLLSPDEYAMLSMLFLRQKTKSDGCLSVQTWFTVEDADHNDQRDFLALIDFLRTKFPDITLSHSISWVTRIKYHIDNMLSGF
jgi:hypothetical protein